MKGVRLTTSAEEFAQVEVMPLLKLLGPKYGRELAVIRGLLREGEFELRDGRVHVGDWALEPGEYELRARAREGFAVADGDGFAVALDTEITTEKKGLRDAREEAIRRLEAFVAKYGGTNAHPENTPDALFRLAALYEERARTDLGMVKANETFFQVVPPAHPGDPGDAPPATTDQRTAQATTP